MRSFISTLIVAALCSLIGTDNSYATRGRSVAEEEKAFEFSNVMLDWAGPDMNNLLLIDNKAGDDDRNEAFIATTGEPYMYSMEGEAVNDRFDTPNARGPLTWRADGLPRGLSINAVTGLISGRAQYDQAGSHPVRLTATSKRGHTHTVKFDWVVRDTKRWEWIDDQYHRVGEPLKVKFQAHDAIGNKLTYKFDGLPPGVEFDEKVGFVGKVKAGGEGKYKVTASVTGGNATDTTTFPWTVFAESRAVAVFAMNDTFAHCDDVGLVGSPHPVLVKYFLGPSDSGPIKIEVTQGAAAVTTEKGDVVGSKSVIIQVTDRPIGWIRFYSIGKAPSTGTDDITIKAFRWVDGTWVDMH